MNLSYKVPLLAALQIRIFMVCICDVRSTTVPKYILHIIQHILNSYPRGVCPESVVGILVCADVITLWWHSTRHLAQPRVRGC